MAGRTRPGVFALIALGVSLVLAFAVSPFASSSPDGLEKVAADEHIDSGETTHALAEGPLADYSVDGAGDGRLSNGIAGVIGVLVTLAVASGAFFVLRALRPTRLTSTTSAGSPGAPSSSGSAPPNPSAV